MIILDDFRGSYDIQKIYRRKLDKLEEECESVEKKMKVQMSQNIVNQLLIRNLKGEIKVIHEKMNEVKNKMLPDIIA